MGQSAVQPISIYYTYITYIENNIIFVCYKYSSECHTSVRGQCTRMRVSLCVCSILYILRIFQSHRRLRNTLEIKVSRHFKIITVKNSVIQQMTGLNQHCDLTFWRQQFQRGPFCNSYTFFGGENDKSKAVDLGLWSKYRILAQDFQVFSAKIKLHIKSAGASNLSFNRSHNLFVLRLQSPCQFAFSTPIRFKIWKKRKK